MLGGTEEKKGGVGSPAPAFCPVEADDSQGQTS